MTLCTIPRRSLVTGASGFIGSAVVRALLADGLSGPRLVRTGTRRRQPRRPRRRTNRRRRPRPAALDRAVDGVTTVFHLAAVYRFWAADPDLFYDVNVGGTMNVSAAAERAGCERLVYTSTVGTIGVADDGRPRLRGHARAFRAPLRALQALEVPRRARGVARRRGGTSRSCSCTRPFRSANATPRRRPTGRTIVEFLNGRIPGVRRHRAERRARRRRRARPRARRAAGRDRVGATSSAARTCRCSEMLATLADICGLRRAPHPGVGHERCCPIVRGAEWIQSSVLHREPTLPSEPVRMATTRMEYDTSRARTELGYTSMPARAALTPCRPVVRRQRLRQGRAGERDPRRGQARRRHRPARPTRRRPNRGARRTSDPQR